MKFIVHRDFFIYEFPYNVKYWTDYIGIRVWFYKDINKCKSVFRYFYSYEEFKCNL